MSNNLLQQLEFYLSDQNLESDEFFRKEIETQGYIAIDSLIKCNKIKKLKANKDSIIKAVKDSQQVALNDQLTGLKRKSESAIPEFKSNKKTKTNVQDSEETLQLNKEIEELKQIQKQKILLKLTVDEVTEAKWQQFQKVLENKYQISIWYMNMSKQSGNVILKDSPDNQQLVKQMVADSHELEFDGNTVKFQIKVPTAEESETFEKEHGGHFKMCMEKQLTIRNSKVVKAKQTFKNEFTFMNKKYSDAQKLKAVFTTIIVRTENQGRIKEPDHSMIMELLKNHENKNKLVDVDYFTVDVHPQHNTSRCFFVVHKDGTQEDFSILKCIDGLVKSLKNE